MRSRAADAAALRPMTRRTSDERSVETGRHLLCRGLVREGTDAHRDEAAAVAIPDRLDERLVVLAAAPGAQADPHLLGAGLVGERSRLHEVAHAGRSFLRRLVREILGGGRRTVSDISGTGSRLGATGLRQ